MKRLLALLALIPLLLGAGSTSVIPDGTLLGNTIGCPGNTSGQAVAPCAITIGSAVGNVPKWVSFDGGGHAGLVIPDGLRFRRSPTSATDVTDFTVVRSANYTGGTNGNVNSAVKFETTNSAGTTSFEWTGLFSLINNGTSADLSQDVALYARAQKLGTGITGAAAFELDDSNVSPTTGSVTFEIDLFANGADANGNRGQLDIVGGKLSGGSGVTPVITNGWRVGAQNKVLANATYMNGGDFTTATYTNLINSEAGAVATNGINFTATTFTGNPFSSTGFSVGASGNVTGATITASTEFLAPAGCSTAYNFTGHVNSGMCYSGGNNVLIQNAGNTGITIGSVGQVTTGILTVTGGSISAGTKFTTSGCSVSSTTGGATAGTFTLGANNCTVVVTMNGATGVTAPTGWTCQAHDRTAIATVVDGESSSTTTTASFVIPVTAGTTDVISFSCTGY